MKIRKEKILENSIVIILILIPFFSTIFFYNKIITLIEVIFVSLVLLFTLLFYKDARVNFKWLLLYYITCLLYLLLSYFYSFEFISLVPNNFDYIFFNEFLTVIKLMMPITFIYSLYYQKIKYEKYIFVLKWWTILIAGSIIISNIFKIGLSSYGDISISVNIFEWGKESYYQGAASKGFFMYANQIATWLLMLLVLFFYDFIRGSKKSCIYIFLIILSMIILGTRVSTIGGLLVFCVLFILALFYRKRNVIKLSVMIFIWGVLIPVSPYQNRLMELTDYGSANNNQLIGVVLDEQEKKEDSSVVIDKTKYVYNNYDKDRLPNRFFEDCYPIKYDEDFWYDFVSNTNASDINYRLIEKSIIKRVVDINNNDWDVLLGISNSRIQNIINIENDFLLHFYAFGIVGSLVLLAIYLILIFISLKQFFRFKSFYSMIMCSAIALFLFCSYLTGNTINSLNITLPFSFIASGIFIKEVVSAKSA